MSAHIWFRNNEYICLRSNVDYNLTANVPTFVWFWQKNRKRDIIQKRVDEAKKRIELLEEIR